LGRPLTREDTSTAVISYGFWRRRFSGDTRVIGSQIAIRGNRFTIVGVLPREFAGVSIDTAPDLRLPVAALPVATGERAAVSDESASFEVVVRLRPGVTAAQAATQTNAIWRAEQSDRPLDWRVEKGVQLEPLRHGVSRLRDRFSGALKFLAAAVGLLMLMVC